MFLKRLKLTFLFVTILGSIFLLYSWYSNYSFKNNPLDEKIVKQIQKKHHELYLLAYQKFGIKKKIPVKVSDKMPSRLFGAATSDRKGTIVIYLNKKRFKESVDYMIDDVLPHEYAHAVMFALGDFTDKKGGHTKKWQDICKALDGLRCNRFVDNNDIIIGKTNIF